MSKMSPSSVAAAVSKGAREQFEHGKTGGDGLRPFSGESIHGRKAKIGDVFYLRLFITRKRWKI
jgi:hypothetical protein